MTCSEESGASLGAPHSMNVPDAVPAVLQPFVGQRTILLQTKKRDGTWVDTPVNVAVRGEHAYIRTYAKAWKSKRLKNFPEVRFCPSTLRGKPIGTIVLARARLLTGEEAREAAGLLAHKHPLLHGLLVPLAHRLMRTATLHYELSDFEATPQGVASAPAE